MSNTLPIALTRLLEYISTINSLIHMLRVVYLRNHQYHVTSNVTKIAPCRMSIARSLCWIEASRAHGLKSLAECGVELEAVRIFLSIHEMNL